MKMNTQLLSVSAILFLFVSRAPAQAKSESPQAKEPVTTIRPAVTFVELGSVKCIPCRQMQPVMKAIEEKYAGRVKVVFHDVWTDEGRSSGDRYDIRLIPTQVFLDSTGKEFFRHEGFYPEAEIHRLLQKRGLTPLKTNG
jgi:thioredoxin 1